MKFVLGFCHQGRKKDEQKTIVFLLAFLLVDDLGNMMSCVKRSMPKTIIINKGTYMKT
jgi:hypothetical protein